MKLSARRSKFVDEYLLDFKASRSARAAGYAVSGARVTAHRLLTDANVKASIALKTQEMAQQYDISKEKVITELQAAIKVAETKRDAGAMIRGWIEIAKIMGFYAPEVIKLAVTTENKVLRAKYEALRDEELMAIINGNSTPKDLY